MTPDEYRTVNRRRAGEVLLWLGILVMLGAAVTNHETTGNQFLALFGSGLGAVFAGLALSNSGLRR